MYDTTEQLYTAIKAAHEENESAGERMLAERFETTRYHVKRALGRETQRISARPKTWDEAVKAISQEETSHTPAIIEGVTAETQPDMCEIWAYVERAQNKTLAAHARKREQSITLPYEPVAIAFLSDLHLGSAGVDYTAVREDAEIVRDTPGMYAGFHGDGTDAWLVGKLVALQRGQVVNFDAERMLFEGWVDIIAGKLLWWVQGNHDLWHSKLVGSDVNRELVKRSSMLWDNNQCAFTLNHCNISRTVVVRHKWKYSSVYNPAHGMMVGFDRGDVAFDWAVMGHTHQATLCYPFYKHNRVRHAILTGTYKRVDAFGEELGFPSSKGSGCGAMVLDVDGSALFVDNLTTAANYLAFLRGR